ncbi:hypothetical protein HYZ41_01760 [archaeon]|nr:hypothetical protein [archaeon]
MPKKSAKSKKSSKAKKVKTGSMPTEAQIKSAAKELEKMPIGKVIVRNGFKFARSSGGHVAFQKK